MNRPPSIGAPLAVLRPEPGNAATCARIVAAGGRVLSLPLFAVRALALAMPDPAAHDALLLTSANAVRHAGVGLDRLRGLPVYAIGAATAAAAEAAGLRVVAVGNADAPALAVIAREDGVTAALLLGARELAHAALPGVSATVAVYASEPVAVSDAALAGLAGSVALLHSPRAAARLAAVVVARERVAVAAISAATLAAAGAGWARTTVADAPTDAALVAAALALAD